MNLNKVYLIGRLAADPEFRTTPSGQEIANLRVATNRIWIDSATGQRNETTEFHNVVTWGRLAQIANQYLKRGSLVMIEGRLQTRNWEGKDGVKRYRTEIIAENLQLGPKPKQEDRGEEVPQQASQQAKEEIPIVSEEEPIIEEEEVDLKEVPF